jgi:CPA2 family monovalent cation:H+ antiporter-2
MEALGVDAEHARELEQAIRLRDLDRLALQQAQGPLAGAEMMRGRTVQPEPLSVPRRQSQRLDAGPLTEKEDAAAPR